MGKNGSPLSPEKETYRIGEVAALTQIEPYVLRYWETEFPTLHPEKSPHGQRLYRRADIETILTIKDLLYEQGFTIAGARKQLQSREGQHLQSTGPFPAPSAASPARVREAATREQLRAVRAELERLLTLLSHR